MKSRAHFSTLIGILCAATAAWPATGLLAAQDAGQPPLASQSGELDAAETQLMLEEAKRTRTEAEQVRREAMKVAERARETARLQTMQDREEIARAREELSRTHRELREATREIARAHRDLTRSAAHSAHELALVREINLGDRAVMGVVLGKETAEGVELIGVSPDGPAERAGLKTGDILVSIRGEKLAGDGAAGRETIYRVMDETGPGAVLKVEVLRDGQSWSFDVTAERREPSSWQTMIRIPDAPPAPGAPGEPRIVVERIEVPNIDMDALDARIQALNKEMEARKFLFVTPEGEEIAWDGEWESEAEWADGLATVEDLNIEIAEFSELAEEALADVNIWFGLPQAQGLELAAINERLGSYFKADRGVLVIRARDGNAYQLRSGDVVLDIGDRAVNSPTDLMRALREIEPGTEVVIAIKRDRRNKTLEVVMPENRLGHAGPGHAERH